MAGIYDMIYTNAGSRLLADVIAQATTLEFTKIVIGSGSLPTGKTEEQMEAVIEPVADLKIKKKVRAEDEAEVIIGTNFDNSDIEQAFYFREMAVFARAVYADGTKDSEVLYMYGNAKESAEYIPTYASETIIEKRIDIITYVGSKTNVSLEIVEGINATKEELEELENNLSKRIDANETDISVLQQLPHVKLQIGGERPDGGPWIWFDGEMTDIKPQELVLNLIAGSDSEVQAEVEQQNYNVENATTNEQQIASGKIFVDVID